jgi:hypothetical protein
MSTKLGFALGFLLLASSCTHAPDLPGDPKSRLSEYVARSFAVKGPGERADLGTYLTGEAKRRLDSWSDDQFRAAFVDSGRTFVKLVLKEVKPVSENEMEITYEITYVDQKGHDARVTNKKLAQLVLEQGKWMIADVHNIKQLVEYTNEMSL